MREEYRILIVEDSPVVLKILHHLLDQNPVFTPVLCSCYQEAQEMLNKYSDYYAAVVDLNLPDAPDGEIVDLVLKRRIPCIVLTGNFDDQLRLTLLNKGVLDYITKDSRYSFNHVIKVVDRLRKNKSIKVLVAEDSSTSRLFIKILLEQYRFQVIEAENGQEALARLEADSGIRMLITDHNMPLVNGYELVRMLRHSRRFQDLVIIGLSAEGDNALSAKFIKAGASDFLKKPFYHEEFHCRVIHNLESQEMLETIRNLASLDPLTKLKNRRYLFEEGEVYFQKSMMGDSGFSLAMLDLDHFKSVNDTYGHMVGDDLLKEVAAVIEEVFSGMLSCRFGGEEFCVVGDCTSEQFVISLKNFMEYLHRKSFTEARIKVTCSIGVCQKMVQSLDEAIKVADSNLYEAKRLGRDRIVCGDKKTA